MSAGEHEFDWSDIPQPAKLPGPWGPFGGPSHLPTGGDGELSAEEKQAMLEASNTLEELAEKLADVDIIIGQAGQIVMIVSVTHGGALKGISQTIKTVVVIINISSDIIEWLANDPPRSEYKQEPFCSQRADLSELLPTDPPAPPAAIDLLDASQDLLSAYANTFAALELHRGAHLAKDIEWMKRHRESFVKYYNAGRAAMFAVAESIPDALAALKSAVDEAGVNLNDIAKKAAKNAEDLESAAREQFNAVLAALASQCGEYERFVGQGDKFTFTPGAMGDLSQINRLADRLKAITKRIDVYK